MVAHDLPIGRITATRTRPGRLLGDVIASLGFCDRETVEDLVREARAAGRPMGQIRRQTARVILRINRRSPRSLASPRSPRSRR
jgi:hypothetical protein